MENKRQINQLNKLIEKYEKSIKSQFEAGILYGLRMVKEEIILKGGADSARKG